MPHGSRPPARLKRDAAGVFHVRGAGLTDLCWGLGRAHAVDRPLQMLLMRLLGRGRAAEVLGGGDTSVAVDAFFRRMNWGSSPAGPLTPDVGRAAQAYCDGVNAGLAKRAPWELRLLGYRPEPWTVEDSCLVARMIGYLTLAQSQAEVERWLVEMVQAGIDVARLEELFPGQLGGLEVDLVRAVRLGERLVPAGVSWGAAAPRPLASNNWALAGSRTASGSPILANDPHLEGNRLPNAWYEVVLETPDRWGSGATMPGLPGILVGRTPDLAWGATYAFLDAVDSWIEECRDGTFRRDTPAGTQWRPFRTRRETIRRREGGEHVIVFHENDHGVLDGDPSSPGLYLATRWSGAAAGAASLQAMLGMWTARSVEQGRERLGRIEPAFNWVLADRAGHVGYQMSGLLPRRRVGASGLVPLPGWDPGNDWQGFVPPEDLPRCLDPEAGYVATANNDLNHLGRVAPITVPMAPYRAQRIATCLEARRDWTAADVQALQLDDYSLQAERFMEVWRPLLPDSANGRLLAGWDRRYDVGSLGASAFESVYGVLLEEAFGAGLGDALGVLRDQTGIVADFYHCFDRVLLAEESAWFSGRSREAVHRAALRRGLALAPGPWGEGRRLDLAHLLLGGRLPRWCGFDRGPLVVRGGRATIHQCQVYRSGGRVTSFVPSFRFVTELARDEAHTSLLGGPSDRRFSRWYASEIEAWRSGRYKTLAPEPAGSR